ncbi:MobA/MobL family protein [Pseudochrobactrum asaccharolyticum]|uniref:MobA/MobL family protein n=1 Tax=Pseudochrobactrum asaccharolyticum TaxID=354351 RepID=UPI0040426906
MKTSLPPDTALYHATAKTFSRSQGRSSVAAAAYRSGTKLHDRRTGETFDYRSKAHVVASFILAPTNAPAWSQNREELWNRVEAAERKSNAVVAREWEISIPRDIPQSEWEAFARKAVQPWVDAGAAVDIAIHCPPDQFGNPQPHVHVLITTRELDPTTESGFSRRKNDTLRKMHESGGKDGAEGKFGDALKAERERLANTMNEFLEAANSPRRVSHLSNAARYEGSLEVPEPEPNIGEQRISTAKRRKKGDQAIAEVATHRKQRALQNALTTTEEEIMSDHPRTQGEGNYVRPKHQQNFKAKLIAQHLPGVSIDPDHLYMVDAKQGKPIKIQMRDGGWVEVENRKATIYGTRGQADTLAAAIVSASHADYIDRLEETAALVKRSQKRRPTRQPLTHPDEYKLPETLTESIADKWRSRGYTNIVEASDGVYVTLGQTRVQDLGTEIRIHGKASDPAIAALLVKATDEWGGELEAYGSQEFKDKLWLEAQRQNVKVFVSNGKLYEPSPEIRKQFEADRAKLESQTLDLEGVKARKKLSALMLEAAAGDKQALADLRERDAYLHLFLTEHLDAEQLESFKQETIQDIEAQLDGFRAYGKDIADEGKESAAPAPSSEPEPESKKSKTPQPA